MKHTLFLTMLAAALLGSGVANAAETLYASQYGTDTPIRLGSSEDYDKLVVDAPLTLTGSSGYLDLYDGATIEFQKKQAAEEIYSIFALEMPMDYPSVYFNPSDSVYNIAFDADAQAIVAASAGSPITLIQDLREECEGFCFDGISPSDTVLKLNGKGYNETVEMGGVSFTYVGPQEDTYTFKAGEIGFTGYYDGSHNLSLVVGGSAPEPATGSLSLLALAGLCARRRRK